NVQIRPRLAAYPTTQPITPPHSGNAQAGTGIIGKCPYQDGRRRSARSTSRSTYTISPTKNIVNDIYYTAKLFVGKTVINRLAVTARTYETIEPQTGKLLRDGRLPQRKNAFELGDGALALGQIAEQQEPRLMSERLQEIAGVACLLHHLVQLGRGLGG